ncbi:nuclear factor NF-kappa-B p100 subunit-like [Dreissena polymorpha]|uniref:Uncharacterized protein n=1 Tax=Dreissena polymorpha TaxID=45954 RepID=A0A9D4EIH1_DREPO|nr:nuclear factor NF-kappa-B p100 subunit-like [Dreissena polymorpha]KAH3780265.1 hypothetical protein DPMN_158077 [Dreissena polymorpha]
MDKITDLDSLVDTDECSINVKVPSSIFKPHHFSKDGVPYNTESGETLNKLFSGEIELSKDKNSQQRKDYFQETRDLTQKLSDICLYDRTIEHGGNYSSNVEKYEIELFTNACIDGDGDTPLHLAIICVYTIQQISYIIDATLNRCHHHDFLNHQNYHYRQTPLHLAVLTGRTDIVRCLLGLGAQTTLQDSQLRTPAHIACGNGDVEILKALLESEGNELTRSVGLYDHQGQTCLHIAALHGNTELVNILLAHGAEINAPDRKSGRTALHFAVESGHINTITCLVRYHELNVDVRTFSCESPAKLAYGRSETRADVVQQLWRCRILEVSGGHPNECRLWRLRRLL